MLVAKQLTKENRKEKIQVIGPEAALSFMHCLHCKESLENKKRFGVWLTRDEWTLSEIFTWRGRI